MMERGEVAKKDVQDPVMHGHYGNVCKALHCGVVHSTKKKLAKAISYE